jgi:hypothetical protein
MTRALRRRRLQTAQRSGAARRRCAPAVAFGAFVAEPQWRQPNGPTVLERDAIEELHGDERLLFVLADLLNGADVGMIQRRGGTSLAAKTLERVRIVGDFRRQEFQRDKAAEFGVFGLLYKARPATADFSMTR